MHRWLPLFTLTACAHAFPPLDLKALPGAAEHPDAHAVVLLDAKTVRFKRDPKTQEAMAEVEVHEQQRLLKGSWGDVPGVEYSQTFSKLLGFDARVVLNDGTSIEPDASKTSDAPAFSAFTLYSDYRVRRLTLPEVPVGGVRELRYTTTFNDVRLFAFGFWFGSDEPTVISRFVIEVPTGWEIDLVLQGPVQRREEQGDGFTRTILEVANVPGERHEIGGPRGRTLLSHALVRLKSWDSPTGRTQGWADDRALSAWMYEKYAVLDDRSHALATTVAAVLKQAGNPKAPADQARALYEYVATKVQYCAVSIGYGGWIPHPPMDVHSAQYGDCKDKANYLRALLTEAGIPSQVAAVDSHEGFPRPFLLPTLSYTFNHMILAVKLGDSVVWADPTERTVPFGLLPARDCETPALLLSKDGEKLVVTPPSEPDQNSELQRFALTVDPDGRGRGTFELATTGVNAAGLSDTMLRGEGKRELRVEKWLDLNTLNVTSVSEVEAEPFAGKAKVRGTLTTGTLVSRSAGAVSLIRLLQFAPRWLHVFPDEKRRTAFAWRWRDTVTGELVFTLPAGARVTALPEAADVESPFFRYQMKWSTTGNTVRVERSMVRKTRVVEPDRFEEFRAAVQQVHVAEARAAVVRFE